MKQVKIDAAMLDLLAQGADIQTIINHGARLLNAPLMVVDTRFRILYISETVNPNVELWNTAKTSHFISDEILANMEESGAARELSCTSEPVQTSLPNGFHAIRTSLIYLGRYRGFVGMYDYMHPFTNKDIYGIQSICKAITALLPGDNDLSIINEDAYESLLYQLLRCQTAEQAAAVYRRFPSISFSRQKQLIALRSNGNLKQPLTRIKEIFRQSLYRHISVVLDDRLVMLFELEQIKDSIYKKTLKDIEELCTKYNLMAGISLPFSDNTFLPDAYRQTDVCLQQRNETKPAVSYFENKLSDSIVQICLDAHPKNFYIHPIIQKIKAYDEEYHVNYLNTLQQYILCAGSLKTTASILGVHYNTIKYRMAAIESIAGQPIYAQGELLATLYFSLLIDDFDKTVV